MSGSVAFFGRKTRPTADPRPEIAQFWAWWDEHRDAVVSAFEEDRQQDLDALLNPAVAALDTSLDWQVVASSNRRMALVVSGGDVLDLRALAERWKLAAPDDPDVGFTSVRGPDPAFDSAVENVDDYDLQLRELVAGTRIDTRRGLIDVVVHHPLFPLLDKDARMSVALLGLQAVLGEEAVRRSIGTVAVSPDAPLDAIALSMLGTVADQLHPAQDQWVLMRGKTRKGPVIAVARRPLERGERPLADTHVAVVLDYPSQPNGLPQSTEIAADVEKLEAEVLSALGGDGPHAIHVGHVTGGGQVVAHFYVDGLEADTSAIQAILPMWTHGTATVQTTPDPAWASVAALRR